MTRKGVASSQPRQTQLTEREKQILEAYKANGRSPAKAAKVLGISPSTCSSALLNIRNKLGSDTL